MLIGSRKLREPRLIGAAPRTQQKRGKPVSSSRRRVLRIWSSRGRGLKLQDRVCIVSPVNPGPHVHKSKRNFVLSLYLGEIHRTGPQSLRCEVVVEASLRSESGVALRLNLRKGWRNRIDERRQSQSRGLKSKTLRNRLFHMAVHSEIHAHVECRANHVVVTDVDAVSIVRCDYSRPPHIRSTVIRREIYFGLVLL